MNLWKWYLRYRYNKASKRTEEMNDRQRCLALLNELHVPQFSHYQAEHGAAEVLLVPYECIDAYTERINTVSRHLNRGTALHTESFNWTLKEVPFDQFFVSTKGFYQDAEQAVARFKTAATSLCNSASNLDNVDTGVNELNSRLLTKLFINVQTLTKTLIEVSLTNR